MIVQWLRSIFGRQPNDKADILNHSRHLGPLILCNPYLVKLPKFISHEKGFAVFCSEGQLQQYRDRILNNFPKEVSKKKPYSINKAAEIVRGRSDEL